MRLVNAQAATAWVMGRRTFEQHSRPGALFAQLASGSAGSVGANRIVKVVLSRTMSSPSSSSSSSSSDQCHHVCRTWPEVLSLLDGMADEVLSAWNIGGPGVYAAQLAGAVRSGTRVFLTRVDGDFDCDLKYPEVDFEEDESWKEVEEEADKKGGAENGIRYSFRTVQCVTKGGGYR